MGLKGQETKDRLMDIAEVLILTKGFTSTSIEELITKAGITKGGFFYHFESKNALAYALMQRYRETDALLFHNLFDRATELTDDPLQQMMVFLKLLAEMLEQLEGLHPGCLVASFTYELHEINDGVRGITADSVKHWREIFKVQFAKIDLLYTRRIETNVDDLADMLTGMIEGGIVLSRALNEPQALPRQLLEYRNYIQLLYTTP